MVRPAALVTAVVAATVLVAGCGGSPTTAPADHRLPPPGQRVPLTDRAAAAIALEHLPGDPSSTAETFLDGQDPDGTVAAEVRYPDGDAQSDGDLVRVAVHPGPPGLDLCPDFGECEEVDTDVAGARAYVYWEREAPEEDPGVVAVYLVRDGEASYVYQSGERITGDPRDLDLRVTVDDMLAVVEDPWLVLATSPDAVTAGEELDDWTPAPDYSR